MKKIFILSLLSLLTSCSSMNSEFECPMKPGIRCESLDKVNARINRGEIDLDNKACISCSKCNSAHGRLSCEGLTLTCDNKNDGLSHYPLRMGETVQRIWIAPFEDTDGNYHGASNVFTIEKPGSWLGAPPKVIQKEEA